MYIDDEDVVARGVQACDCKNGCEFDPHSGEWIIIYEYLHFFALALKQKPGVEYRHWKIWWKLGNGVS